MIRYGLLNPRLKSAIFFFPPGDLFLTRCEFLFGLQLIIQMQFIHFELPDFEIFSGKAIRHADSRGIQDSYSVLFYIFISIIQFVKYLNRNLVKVLFGVQNKIDGSMNRLKTHWYSYLDRLP